MGRPNVNVVVGSCKTDATSIYDVLVLRAGAPFAPQVTADSTKFIIRFDYDLNGDTIELPSDCILEFQGGSLSNGTLVGDATQIIAEKAAIFNGITIDGDWLVPEITSAWFADAGYPNKLSQVMNLCSPNVENYVTIEKGNYFMDAPENTTTACIQIGSNTHVTLLGTLTLNKTDATSVRMVNIAGSNASIEGNGEIVGDKDQHPEYDTNTYVQKFGIRCSASDAVIKGVTVRNCAGTSVLLSYNFSNVTVEDVNIYDGGSNGIAVTKGDRAIIRNCKITNVNLRPGNAIDIEPSSEGDACRNVIIDNVYIENPKTGLNMYNNHGDYCRNIVATNVTAVGCAKRGLAITHRIKDVVVENCNFEATIRGFYASTKSSHINSGESGNIHLNKCSFISTSSTDDDDEETDDNSARCYIGFKDIVFDNCLIECRDTTKPIHIGPVSKGCIFTNCKINTTGTLKASIGFDMNNCYVNCKTISITDANCNVSGCHIMLAEYENNIRGIWSHNDFDCLSRSNTYFLRLYGKGSQFVGNIVAKTISENTEFTNNFLSLLRTYSSYQVVRDNVFYSNRTTRCIDVSKVSTTDSASNVLLINNRDIPSTSESAVPRTLFVYAYENCEYVSIDNNPTNKSGVTAKRPSLSAESYQIGTSYFDTDLGKPIFWDGTGWVYSDGTTVSE